MKFYSEIHFYRKALLDFSVMKMCKMIIQLIFLFEGIAMLITGPLLMVAPLWVLQVYGVKDPPLVAADVVPWFGSLVFLMGWVETRCWGKMNRFEVEAWMIADFLYMYALYVFITRHGQWNIFSFVLSFLFPLLYWPIRLYWLLRVGHYDDVKLTHPD